MSLSRCPTSRVLSRLRTNNVANAMRLWNVRGHTAAPSRVVTYFIPLIAAVVAIAEAEEDASTMPPEMTRSTASLPIETLRAEFNSLVDGCVVPNDHTFRAYCQLRRNFANVTVDVRIRDKESTTCYWGVHDFGTYESEWSDAEIKSLQLRSTNAFRRCLPHLINLDPLWSVSAPFYSDLSDAESHLFFAAVSGRGLRSLSCAGPGFTDRMAIVLADARQLRELRLRRTGITDKSLPYISAMYDLSTLVISGSSLRGQAIGDCIRHLNLRHLDVMDTGMDDETLRDLNDMGELEDLCLAGTEITSDGVKHLMSLRNLRHLNVSRTRVDDKCLDSLQNIKSLQILKIFETKIGRESVERLRARLPLCRVEAT